MSEDETPLPDHIDLIGAGERYLPAGLDIDRLIRDATDELQLMAVWDTYHWRRMLHRMVTRRPDSTFRGELDQLAPVTAVQALAANRRLVELLTARRWYVMRDAREGGASWADIGDALGVSRQSAHEWYQRQIELQEKHVGDFHDAERARAALDD